MKIKNILFVLLFSVLFLSSCQNSLIKTDNGNVQVYFKYGHKNVLDTFENTYQKDMILDGVIKIRFFLTPEELNQILEKANSINYFSLPDTFKYVPVNGITKITDPNPGEQILRIKYQQKDKRTIWTYPLNDNFPEVKDLMELKDFIISIIISKPEYKKLPPTKSGYQ
ncbi:MAG: hypothetical protein IH852_08740 [Bacteroidetes bacterium]|nr:hypothetical protein [Bacteroidota bacterium]